MSTVGESQDPPWKDVLYTKGLSAAATILEEYGLSCESFVLRALLTNAPNSCPPERLFSMFNATFGEDQKRAFGDYLELAMQSQYNKRNL